MIDRLALDKKRAEYVALEEQYQRSIYALQGGIQAIDELLALESDALSLEGLKALTGAGEIGEPVEVQNV